MIQKIFFAMIISMGMQAIAQPWGASGKGKPQFRTETILRGQSFKGNELVQIRQQINQSLKGQGIDPTRYQLEGITLFAKSWGNNATANLIVGKDQKSYKIPRAKNFAFFLIDEPFTYSVLQWDLQQAPGQSDERWQMQFNGEIRIDAMQVHLSASNRWITIPLQGELFSNQTGNIIHLRQRLDAMGIQSQNYKIRSVSLLAKSQAGQATAQLRVGNNYRPAKVVKTAQPGYNFQDERPQSYNLVEWNHAGDAQGVWQILLNGRVKVKTVVIELE